jgi:hypothetical protein
MSHAHPMCSSRRLVKFTLLLPQHHLLEIIVWIGIVRLHEIKLLAQNLQNVRSNVCGETGSQANVLDSKAQKSQQDCSRLLLQVAHGQTQRQVVDRTL